MMTEDQIASHVMRRMENTDGFGGVPNNYMQELRIELLARYMGNKYPGDDQQSRSYNKSQFRSREVFETVESSLPKPLRALFSTANPVVFKPQGGPGDEAFAMQATRVVNHLVRRSNEGDGYLAIHHFLHDALLYPFGVAKVYVRDKRLESEMHRVEGMTSQELAELEADQDIEIIDGREYAVEEMIEGERITVPVFDIEWRELGMRKQLMIDSVPPEQLFVSNRLTSLNFDMADFLCHKMSRTLTELVVHDGYDSGDLEDIDPGRDLYDIETQFREEQFSDYSQLDVTNDTGMDIDQEYTVHECWGYFDFAEKGRPEYRRVVVIGDKVMENEATDYQPLVGMAATLVPHTRYGISPAELAVSIQDGNTHVWRKGFEHISRLKEGRVYVDERWLNSLSDTRDQILDQEETVVSGRGDPHAAVMPEHVPSMLEHLLPFQDKLDQSLERRTGVSLSSLNPEVLQQATAGAFFGAMNAGGERPDMILRNFVETGIKRVFRKSYMLVRKYPDIVRQLFVGGEWMQATPEKWMSSPDIRIDIGLGYNSREQEAQMRLQVMGIQKEAAAEGLALPKHLFNNYSRLIEVGGLGDPDQYFLNPESPEGQQRLEEISQPQPDPRIEIQKMQIDQKREQSEAGVQERVQGKEIDAKLQLQQQQIQAQVESQKLALQRQELILEGERVALQRSQVELEREKLQREQPGLDADAELKQAQARKALAETLHVGDEPGDAE